MNITLVKFLSDLNRYHMAHRNTELAVIQKKDPARLRSRTVETEKRKLNKSRARRKANWAKDSCLILSA